MALGVQKQEDLDRAITAHGRILHDATLTSVNVAENSGLGSINWNDTQSSSLCELVADLGKQLGDNLIDGQVATALLTGVVAETERFSNDKTTPQTMSVSAQLMSLGANQQLVASELEGPGVDLRKQPSGKPKAKQGKDVSKDDGTLEIGHLEDEPAEGPAKKPEDNKPAVTAGEETAPGDIFAGVEEADKPSHVANDNITPKFVSEAPEHGGTLTANTEPEKYDPATDPLSLPKVDDNSLLSHDTPPATPAPLPTNEPSPAPSTPAPDPTPPPSFNWTPPSFVANAPAPAATPQPAEAVVTSSEPAVPSEPAQAPTAQPAGEHLDAAREEVEKALNSAPLTPEPVQALNAQPIDLQPPTTGPAPLPPQPAPVTQPSTAFDPATFGIPSDAAAPAPAPTPAPDFSSPMGQSLVMPMPPSAPSASPAQPVANDPTAPPPVPPPLPFQFNAPGSPNQNNPKP